MTKLINILQSTALIGLGALPILALSTAHAANLF